MWIDSHCHLDAPEFDADRAAVVQRARAAGVGLLVLPAVAAAHFERVRAQAHAFGAAYALGIHPLMVDEATEDDLQALRQALQRHRDDPRLVAVGEIGLDHFVPARPRPGEDPQQATRRQRERQQEVYLAQLRLARDAGLPVLLHVRRSADALLAGLRRVAVPGGIAHAFNGSTQQAQAFARMGFRLGFGGAMTFERALRIRELAATVPAEVPVLETDAPDIPPWWLYRTAAARAQGQAGGEDVAQGRNEPAELPRIAATLAGLRGWTLQDTARRTTANVVAALPRTAALLNLEPPAWAAEPTRSASWAGTGPQSPR
jgi:TatD DNase family protein